MDNQDIIKEFENRFIYWVVLGSTLNDGSEMRWIRENQQPKEIIDFLSEAISQTQKEAYEKGRLETIKEIGSEIQKVIQDSKATFFTKDPNIEPSLDDALYELKAEISDNVGMYFYNQLKS